MIYLISRQNIKTWWHALNDAAIRFYCCAFRFYSFLSFLSCSSLRRLRSSCRFLNALLLQDHVVSLIVEKLFD